MKFYKANSLKASLLIIGGLGFSLTGFLSNYAHAAQIVVGNKSAFYITDIVGGAGGDMFAWGANGSGQLGDGTQADALSPIATAFESDAGQALGPWVRLATNMSGITGDAFEGHTLAIDSDGRLWAWGDNSLGQLGQGNTTSKLKPVRVGNASNWIDVEVGSAFSIALNDEGEIWLWGDNRFGQLGPDVVAEFQSVPTQLPDKDGTVANNDIWIKIAAGAEHVLAIHGAALTSTNGRLYAWGRNTVDQLGLGAGQSSQTNTPTPVNATLWREVEAGSTSSFAITATGSRLHAWGQGAFGNLGLGPTSGTSIQNASTPQEVSTSLGSRTFVGVSAGSSHTLAWSSTGQLFVAGQNTSGQLGISATSPQIYNSFQYLRAGVDSASAGRLSSIILLDDGSVLTAGANDRGQLGNGTTATSRSFTQTSLGAVDLSIDSLSFSSGIEGISEGDTFDLQLLIRNNGTGTVSNAELASIVYDFALSTASVPGAEGELSPVVSAPSYSAAEIGPASAIAADFTLTVPAVTQGDYFVLVELDSTDTLEESDETNNTAVSNEETPILFRSDLTISYVSAAPLVVDTGDTMIVDFTISNGGTGDIPAGAGNGFAYRIFLSEFEDESVGDVYELLPANVGDELLYELGLNAAAATAVLSIDLTVPEEVDLSKTYYVGLVVDSVDQISESDEANNTAFSPADIVTVNGLSIQDALDIAGDPNEPAFNVAGDASWFGQPNVAGASGLLTGAARSPSLAAGDFASITFEFPEPREVTFRWKSNTTSSQNRLFFGANRVPLEPEGSAPNELFGNQDWTDVSFIIPKDTAVGFFYEQGVEAEDDVVFVDDLEISAAITLPDYVVNDIQFDAETYVLDRDRLGVTVTGSNRGEVAALPNDFDVKIWLSLDLVAGDADDVLLGSLNSFQVLDNGASFVYSADFNLPGTLLDADYYILARVDSNDAVLEFNEAPAFTVGDNNFSFSDTNGVVIDRRADLRATNIISVAGEDQQTSIFVGGPTNDPDFNPLAGENETKVFGQFIIEPIPGDSSELAIRFDVLNDGLAAVEGLAQAFDIQVYLKSSREGDPADGFLVVGYEEEAGLAQGAGRTYEITTNIPDTVPAGQFYYVGIVVDSSDAVPESDEENNTTYSADDDVFIGELPLEIALNDNDLDDLDREDPDIDWDTQAWVDGFIPSSVTQANPESPWFGQTSVFGFDSAVRAAAQSGPVASGGVSYMETVVEVGASPLQVSFYWSVSSQFEVIDGQVFEDVLDFSIREGDSGAFEQIFKISGEVDWVLRRHTITEPGTYTLRWAYTENGDGSRSGADTGWVDAFSSEAPDFTVSLPGDSDSAPAINVTINDPVPLDAGDTINVAFDVLNQGGVAYSNTRVQIRLSQERGVPANLNWNQTNPEDFILFDGFVDIGSTFNQTFFIPEAISESGLYYVGVWAEYRSEIAESNESNNLAWTDSATIEIDPSVTFTAATEFTPDPSNGWSFVGDGRWFPTTAEVAPGSSGGSSVTVPELGVGENAGFEAIIGGPRLLQFRWKADTRESLNYAELRINGVPQRREFGADAGGSMRISGDVNWVEETILIPAGTQIVSWHYIKNAEPRVGDGDSVYVDYVNFNDDPVTPADEGIEVDRPDLDILSVDYNADEDPDTEVQEYALERDQFPLTAVVANRGATPSGNNYDDIYLEVRLSSDQRFDEADVIVGSLALTEVLESGARLVFSGNVDLPINVDESAYYLLVKVTSSDPDFEEFALPGDPGSELLDNNLFTSSDQDIQILHLPRLSVDLMNLVAEKVYYPKENLSFEWDLVNIGLGDIDGLTPYTQNIELWAFPKEDPPDPVNPYGDLDPAFKVLDLVSVTESEYLPGALTRDDISESSLSYRTTITLPRAGELLTGLSVITGEPEDEDIEVTSNLAELAEYVYFLVIIRDTSIEQSSNLSIRYFTNARFRISSVPFSGGGTFVSYDDWRTLSSDLLTEPDQLSVAPTIPGANENDVDVSNAGVENLFYYAFNLPLRADTRLSDDAGAGAVLGRFGTVFFDSDDDGTVEEYQQLTFPIIRGATDLRYTVQASNNMLAWEDLIDIEPPYLDERSGFFAGFYGAQSLTNPVVGSGSLIIQPSAVGGGYSPVVSIINNNYSAMVTVRDYVDLGGGGSRFMRVRVTLVP